MLTSIEEDSQRSEAITSEAIPSKEQSAKPWRSDRREPYVLCEISDDNGINEIPKCAFEKFGVIVPRDGWYAVCFGQGGSFQDKREKSTPEHRLALFQPRQSQQNCKALLHWPLPLTHQNPNKNKQKGTDKKRVTSLTDIHIGKLMFFTQNARILVVEQRLRGNPTTVVNDDNSTSQWCLVHAPRVVVNSSEVANNDARYIIDHKNDRPISEILPEKAQEPKWSIGAIYQSRLICSTCLRTFRSAHAVLAHVKESHSVGRTEQPSNHPRKLSQVTTQVASDIWNKPLRVVYEDDVVAVVVKPQGMAVMGGFPSLCRSDLLMPFKRKEQSIPSTSTKKRRRVDEQNSATSDFDEEQNTGDHDAFSENNRADWLKKPVPVHRLDAATGGLLVIAKTKIAECALKSSFASQSCRKQYRALILGRLYPREGDIDQPIDGRKPAHTLYNVVGYYKWQYRDTNAMSTEKACQAQIVTHTAEDVGDSEAEKADYNQGTAGDELWCTVVDLYPKTGRRHQLRKHMKFLGHPIMGDIRYSGGKGRSKSSQEKFPVPRSDDEYSRTPTTLLLDPNRLYLYAMEVVFPHPTTGVATTCRVDYPPPEWPILE